MVLPLLAGCAAPKTKPADVNSVLAEIEASKQLELAVRENVESNQRLGDVSYRVLSGAVSLCGEKTRSSMGFRYWNKFSFNPLWRSSAVKLFKLNKVIQVSSVIPDSPADKSGLKSGDILLSIDGWPLPVGKKALKAVDIKIAEIGKGHKDTIAVNLLRNGEEKSVLIKPARACDYPVSIDKSESVNAFADGKSIFVSSGMMDFARDDAELALVVSHELSHDLMGHIEAKKQNAVAGAAGGLVIDVLLAAIGVNTQGDFSRKGGEIGGSAYSVEFEQEADYVGMYAFALAGYKIDQAPYFWRRMAVHSPASIKFSSSHPTTPDRFVALEATVREINKKIAANIPLKPEMKKPNISKTGTGKNGK